MITATPASATHFRNLVVLPFFEKSNNKTVIGRRYMLKKFVLLLSAPRPMANPNVYAVSSLILLTRTIAKYRAHNVNAPDSES